MKLDDINDHQLNEGLVQFLYRHLKTIFAVLAGIAVIYLAIRAFRGEKVEQKRLPQDAREDIKDAEKSRKKTFNVSVDLNITDELETDNDLVKLLTPLSEYFYDRYDSYLGAFYYKKKADKYITLFPFKDKADAKAAERDLEKMKKKA